MAPETISTALGNLKKLGLVSVEKAAGENGRFASNNYIFHADLLWQLTPELVSSRLGGKRTAPKNEPDTTTDNVVGDDPTATATVVGTATANVAAPLRLPYRKNEQEEPSCKNEQTPLTPQGGSDADAPPTGDQGEVVSAELVPVADAVPDVTPEPKKSTRGERLPAGWYPTAETVGAIREQFPWITDDFLRAEHLKFTDYWAAKTGRTATKLDWNATWRNWIRTATERTPAAARQTASSQGMSAPDRKIQGYYDAAEEAKRMRAERKQNAGL